jgi:type IV pilus assembly protein PilX
MKAPAMNAPSIARPRAQRGATLIVLLVMLGIVTLLTVSSLRTTTMEERMAGNFRDRDRALQAAEAAVQAGLVKINTNNWTGITKLTPVANGASAPNWEGTWSDATSTAVTITGANLNADPRYMVEDLGSGSYRVTGRAVGGSGDSVVVLQATYSIE